MLEQINLEIEKLLKDYTHPDSVHKKMSETKRMLDDASYELKKLKGIVEKEQIDVEKMGQVSLKTLFYKCLGTHDKQVAKEKEEALTAVLKYESCKKTVEELADRVSELTREHYDMSKVQDELEALREEKYRVMAKANMPEYATIEQLEKEISSIKSEIKELNEAIKAGNMVITTLNETIKLLESADDWSTFDLLGGGFMADVMKHDKIDKAKQTILDAQTHIQRLQVELQDVNMNLESSIQITECEVFADFFFDGLLADWYMQSKIDKSRNNVDIIYRKVRETVKVLSNQLELKEKDLWAKEMQIKSIIEKA